MQKSQSIIEGLKRFSTTDVADALLQLKHPHGGFLPGLTLWSPARQSGPTKIVGPAYTVKFVRNNHVNEPKPQHHYIDKVPNGAVLFISAPPGTINCVYGGLMTNRAKFLEAAGTVVDGRIRDLQEHRDAAFPVFARDVGAPSHYEVVRVSELNGPVSFGDSTIEANIHPGDIIVGDLDGVVCIPSALAQQVLDLIPSKAAADERIMEDLKAGSTFEESSKKHRANVKKP